GSSWSAARRLFGGWWPLVAIDPSSEDGSSVHFVASPGLYRRSNDGGASLVGSVTLTTYWSWWSNGVRQFAWDVGPDSAVHVAFPGVLYPMPSGDFDLHYRRLDPRASPLTETDQSLLLSGLHEELHYENMQIPATPAHQFDRALTVELWMRPDPGCPTDTTLLLREHVQDYRGALRLQTHAWNGRRPSGKILTTNGLAEVWGGELLSDGQWHHLALSYDAAVAQDNLRLYVDGHLSATATGLGPCSPTPESFYVGGGAGSVYQTFRGAIDEVRLWDRALTEEEIHSRTTVRLRSPMPSLVASYPLDGSTRETSGRGLDGVLMYRETFAASTPAPLPVFLSAPMLGASVQRDCLHRAVADWATGFSAEGLPPGVTLDPVSGVLSGAPTTPGVFDTILTAANRHGTTRQTLRFLVQGTENRLFREDFDTSWSTGWDPLPADPSYYQLSGDGALRLRANYGDTWQHYNRPLNLFSIPAPDAADWVATLAVRRYEPAAVNYNSVHVVAWDDTDNNVRLTYSHGDGRNVGITAENEQRMESYGEGRDFGAAPFLLRLTKKGDLYQGFWSTNGVDFLPVSTNAVHLGDGSPARIGFWMGIDPTQANLAWIDSFEVTLDHGRAPSLAVSVELGLLRLAWPAAGGPADVLESSTDLTHWTPVEPAATLHGDSLECRVPISGPGRFFRVRRP
ncbi:MAG: hypothetical protein IT580_00205, partial [Verrucomicrobiales bacterium]|nr:hypothetical protein [Verrucomicrobiales bacterium]